MVTDAIPAATLVLVRDVPAGPPEVLMVERSATMAFAPGALVFTGGRIDPEDRALAAGMKVDHADARIAAIRETLEECAVPVGLAPMPDQDSARSLQRALLDGGGLGGLLSAHQLTLDPLALRPFARWIPDHEVSRRFDTIFFIAVCQSDVEPNVGSPECQAALWLSAARALELERAGHCRLIYPTRKNLERLAQFRCGKDMLADARAHAVTPITARIETIDGIEYVTIPDGQGYPVTRDRADAVWRG